MNTAVISRITDVMSCAGFCSRDDGLLHAVVLRRGGEIIDLAHDRRGAPIAEGLIGTIEGARDLTAFWSNQDDVRNVICVADGGRVVHFSQKGSSSWTRAERRRVPEALRIAAYDLGHHGLVLSRTAEITDQPFHGVAPEVMQHHADTHKDAGHAREDEVVAIGQGEEQPVFVGTYGGALDIAGFFVGEKERYVIEADRTGAITEIGYGALQPASRRVVATLPNVHRISACHAGDGQMGRKLLASTDQGAVWLYEYGTDIPRSGRNLDLQASTDVHCFSTRDNEVRVLLASAAEVLTGW